MISGETNKPNQVNAGEIARHKANSRPLVISFTFLSLLSFPFPIPLSVLSVLALRVFQRQKGDGRERTKGCQPIHSILCQALLTHT